MAGSDEGQEAVDAYIAGLPELIRRIVQHQIGRNRERAPRKGART